MVHFDRESSPSFRDDRLLRQANVKLVSCRACNFREQLSHCLFRQCDRNSILEAVAAEDIGEASAAAMPGLTKCVAGQTKALECLRTK
jgi:hypothetical protein